MGDFAVALWDGPRWQLYLGRDPFGARPLFFASRRGTILWASTPRALLASGEIDRKVDDDWVAAYLINAQWADRSPLMAIEAVPPGHAVIFGSHGSRRWRFWQPTGSKEIRYPDDESYEEAFRELFYDAVRCLYAVRQLGDGTALASVTRSLRILLPA